MPTYQYDAIVVGAGPAGSMTAYRLSKAGARVLIVDAQKFPREKACGGGVQQRALQRIPFDFSEVVRGRLNGMALSFKFAENWTRTYPQHLVYSVLRYEFDAFLLQRAADVGACVKAGTRVNDVSVSDEHATVHTSDGDFTARFVIGADGANSVVSRLLNDRSDYFWQAALYCEIPERYLDHRWLGQHHMRVDWGTLPSGYAWIFPKDGSANIGVGCPARLGRMLRPYLTRFMESERILKPQGRGELRFRGHQLPTLTSRTKIESPSILLVGDAAGLVEPFTGDGISQACHSAQLAAACVLSTLNGDTEHSASYSSRVLRDIAAELIWSRKLLSLAVAFPRLMYRAFRLNDQVWNTFCQVLRAEQSFRNVKGAVLGPLEFLWTPVEALVEILEQHKIDRYLSGLREPITL